MMKATPFLLLTVLTLSGCATVTAKAGPDGKITDLHYSAFLRKYEWSVEESPQGLKVRVGAESETDKLTALLGAVVGAASTLAAHGVVP